MTRTWRIAFVAAVLGLAGAGAAAVRFGSARARGPAFGPAASIDGERTLAYVESWARRDRWDRFPESPSFAFYNLYATRALGGAVSPELRGRIVEYLRRCQGRDGGFAAAPGTGESHVVPTLYTLRALALLGAGDAIDRGRAMAFLASLARPDGAYRGREGDAEGSLGTTFHAVAALELLGAVNLVDRPRTVSYLSSHRTADGGFALRPGAAASPAATFMAVRTLKLLGALDGDTSAAVARHLAGSRYSGRLRAGELAMVPEIEDEANVLAALADVGRLDVVDRAEVERFVRSLYVAENGGFGPQPGLGTTPPSTYQAIACLATLGRLRAP
ncbi:MAG TPA: prenyltransferase/squalene oxidase repeat-containing protein [Anaeromyxobacter sp.]